MFSSLSLPDDSITANAAPPIIICSYDTYMVSYQIYHRLYKYHPLSLLTSLLLSHGTSQTVLRHVESTIKNEFSRTIRVYFCHTWNDYRDTRASEISLCILLWSSFEVVCSLLFQKLRIYVVFRALQNVAPCCGPLSHLLGLGDRFYCSTDVGNPCRLFILSFCKHHLCGKSSA